jgi:hypothetical protein
MKAWFLRPLLASMLGLVGGAGVASAAPVEYTFSTGAALTELNPIGELAGSSVSGSFTYDSASPQTGTTLPTDNPANAAIYGAFLSGGVVNNGSFYALSATVSGGNLGATVFNLSDPRGSVTVSNGGLSGGQDLLGPSADPFGAPGVHNLQGAFDIGQYTLVNLRIFWTDFSLGSGFLDDQNLPATLPSGPARLALDFRFTGTGLGIPVAFEFYDNVRVAQVTSVPEPQTYALLLAGLGLIGFVGRRKRR